MSMLEEIKAAEEAAADAKREANLTTRNMLREAEDKATADAEAMITAARDAAKKTIATSEAQAKIKAKALVDERARVDRAQARAAREKLAATVAYIVEKVVV